MNPKWRASIKWREAKKKIKMFHQISECEWHQKRPVVGVTTTCCSGTFLGSLYCKLVLWLCSCWGHALPRAVVFSCGFSSPTPTVHLFLSRRQLWLTDLKLDRLRRLRLFSHSRFSYVLRAVRPGSPAKAVFNAENQSLVLLKAMVLGLTLNEPWCGLQKL